MLTDDWRGAALHYMRERVRSLLARCRAGSKRTETHTLVSLRGITLAAHLLYLPYNDCSDQGSNRRPGRVGNGFFLCSALVFILNLPIEVAEEAARQTEGCVSGS